MSKHHRTFYLIIFAAALNLQLFTNARAQACDAVVKVDEAGKSARIWGIFSGPPNKRNLSFLPSIAGVERLGERISNVSIIGTAGGAVGFRKLTDGEFLAEDDIRSWEYTIDLSPPKKDGAAAHVSWTSGDRGVLMLDDLLPQSGKDGDRPGRVNFELPAGWSVISSEKRIEGTCFEILDPERAVFFVGTGWRSKKASDVPIELAISGEWLFSDQEAAEMAAEIYSAYRKMFGDDPVSGMQVAITKFPNDVRHGQWQAETRGHTVTIISSDMPFKSQSLQRLHEQLRHEIFHLWVPNGLNLKGNYGWFYEGFALYQSLKTAVALNRIRFDDFLDTLSRAHSIDSRQTRRLSLIEASSNRFSGANTQVYARGMLVAFLTDLALLEKSKGKRSAANLLRELYQRHRSTNHVEDANTAVIGVMQANTELWPVIERYIRGAGKVEWSAELAAAGIDSLEEKGHTTLKVRQKLNGRQKALLDKLGYNNWRKLSRNSE
jgi:hypothetical protein